VRRCALLVLVVLLGFPGAAAAALTNTAHLDWLGDTVLPPAQPGHSTYGSDPVGVLWTYADRQDDGSYKRVGGGTYDAATNTYGQGAFNADDMSRASVVYVRDWRLTGSVAARDRARALLRGLTYLQSPNGDVVLWMQPDGTLHPSADPPEEPDPSDSGASYWLARTVWALGEGYAAFRHEDPAFAAFLRERLDLAIAALDREVLSRYGQTQIVDGRRVPAWLIVDGADATAEAMLGLAAYVDAGGPPAARTALARFAQGVAALGTTGPAAADSGDVSGAAFTWPYGAVLPNALSRSEWHAWASQMPEALARAATTLHRPDLLAPALADSASFTPHLLITAGPENGWNPTPTDHSQIAYGADSRLQDLLATAQAAHSDGLRRLAGFEAAWYFGDNPARAPMYDPATGVTFDGVAGDGTINRNSGAESTIHGLLSMLALDADPDVAAQAQRGAAPVRRTAQQVLEAEDAQRSGGAAIVTPDALWTGESQWGGTGYVTLPPGAEAAFHTPGPGLIEPVAFRTADATGGATSWGPLGTLRHTNAGAQGASAIPGVLEAQTLPRTGANPVATQTARGTTQLDAIIFQPPLESLRLGGQTLYRSFASTTQRVPAPATSYDTQGRRYATATHGTVPIGPGGFAIG
jgi:hypothetical protein